MELYNNNSTEVELLDWYIDDELDKGGTPITFSTKIDKKEYKIIDINKSLLNNTGDSVSLLDENKNLLFQFKYQKSQSGSSIQKLSNSKWYITSDITKEGENLKFIDLLAEAPKENTEKSEETIYTQDIISDTTPENALETSTLTESVKVSQDGLVLGSYTNNTQAKKDFSAVKFYKAAKPFTIESSGHTYIITEKDIPGFFEVLKIFIEKAFW